MVRGHCSFPQMFIGLVLHSDNLELLCLSMIIYYDWKRKACYASSFLILHLLLQNLKHNGSHLASTYSALAILKIIGYDFSLFDSESIVRSMKNLQQPDGRYVFSCLWFPLHTFSLLLCHLIMDSKLKVSFQLLGSQIRPSHLSCKGY